MSNMKYPIGIQTFDKIIDGGYVYVDKRNYGKQNMKLVSLRVKNMDMRLVSPRAKSMDMRLVSPRAKSMV